MVITWKLEVLTILMGGRTKFPPFKMGGGWAQQALPCLEGGFNKFWTHIFPFCSPPLPVINYQTLISRCLFDFDCNSET